jgi:Zn-dependent M28 family amino/carboxypeptidase
MRTRALIIFAVVLVLASTVLYSQAGQAPPAPARKVTSAPRILLPPPALAAIKAVDGEKIRTHVRFLAHDLLEGRGTGQRGGDLAAEYIAALFALYGLKPAGDNGTYLQKVPLVGVTTQPETTMSVVPQSGQPIALRFRDDYVVTNESLSEDATVDADVVFVGYGVEAPEYKWDDYKGADLKGKVLLMLVSEPPSDTDDFFKGRALTYYGRWTYKYEQAARKGAVAAILVHKTEMASYGWDVVRNSWSGERSYIRDNEPKLKAASWVQLDIARQMAQASGKNLDEMMEQAKSRDFRPMPLSLRVRAQVKTKVRDIQSSNVLGLLPGSDPKLREQAVVYSAHYDHLGVRPGTEGDNIYNGAEDNATGTAMIIEMARVLSQAPQKPKRSILFAAVTAEEQGLRGSEFLGRNSPVPPARLTLNLNFDNVAPRGIPEEVEAVGSERITFYPVVQATAKEYGLAIVPDSFPEAGYYYRSDHFSMARVGVPAFSIDAGAKYKGRDRAWGEAQSKEYTAKRYHQPSDEYRPEMDFTTNVVIARFGLALGWRAAELPRLIGWQPGDEFEAARKQSRARP